MRLRAKDRRGPPGRCSRRDARPGMVAAVLVGAGPSAPPRQGSSARPRWHHAASAGLDNAAAMFWWKGEQANDARRALGSAREDRSMIEPGHTSAGPGCPARSLGAGSAVAPRKQLGRGANEQSEGKRARGRSSAQGACADEQQPDAQHLESLTNQPDARTAELLRKQQQATALRPLPAPSWKARTAPL